MNFKNKLILKIVFFSFLMLTVYLPIHTISMNMSHDMNISKEECPFTFANNLICNSFIKKDTNLISGINYNINNFSSFYLSYKLILIYIFYSLFYLIFLRYLYKNNSSHKIIILFDKLFSSGILNSKAF